MFHRFCCLFGTGCFNSGLISSKRLALIAGCIVACQLQAQPLSVPDQKFWTPDGPVNAILTVGKTVYIGGDFSYVGPRTGPAVTFDQATGHLLASPPAISGTVKAVVADGAGGWFIGGTFTRIGDAAITNLAHLYPDLSVDSAWSAQLNGSTINALALDDGTLYVGGSFSRIGGQVLSGLAGLNATTAEVTWNPAFSGTVNAMQVDSGLLYVGGSFFSVGSSNRQNLAAISITTALANDWNPAADTTVLALQVSGSTVYVGGQFANVGTKPRNRLAALSTTTGVASASWNPNPNGIVRALAVGAGTVYVGGDFTTISVSSRRGFAAVSSANGAAQTLDLHLQSVGTVNLVRSLLLEGSSLYVGGQFTNALAELHFMVVGVDLTGITSLPSPLATDFNGAAGTAFGVNALASAGGKLLVTGDFQSFGGVARQRAAALSIDTGAVLPWAPGFDGAISSMAYGTNGIYVGGAFTNVNVTTPAAGVAVVDPLVGDAVPFPFSPTNGFSPVAINTLIVRSNTLYVGGAFTGVGSLVRRFVAAVDAVSAVPISTFDAKLGGGFSGVTSMALAGDDLYLAGDFSTVNGSSFPRLTSVSATTGVTNTWIPLPSPNQPAYDLVATANAVYVVGPFTTISGITLNSFAAYDPADNSLIPIDASVAAFSSVTAIDATETALYIGGSFASIGGENRQNLAVLAAAYAGAYDWNPSPDVAPSVIKLSDNYAFAGGTFRFMGQGAAKMINGFFAAFQRSPQATIVPSGSNIQITATTGDRAEAVLQSTSGLKTPAWSNIATNDPGFVWTIVEPAGAPQGFFRVISR